jgi:hypothetical protein
MLSQLFTPFPNQLTYVHGTIINEKNNLLVIMNSHNMRSQFINFFPELIHRLKSCTVFGELPGMQNWIEKVISIVKLFFYAPTNNIKVFSTV